MTYQDQFKSSSTTQFELFIGAVHAIYLSLVASVENSKLPLFSAGFRARAAILAKRTAEAIVDQADLTYYELSMGLDSKTKMGLDIERQNFIQFVSNSLVAIIVQADQRLRLGNMQLKSMIGDQSGGIGELIGQQAVAPNYTLKDSAGRTWTDPVKLFGVVARDFVYQSKITAALAKAKAAGLDAVLIQRSGEIEPVLMSIEAVKANREEIFHVNSSSEVIGV